MLLRLLRLRQRSTVWPSSYLWIEGRVCAIRPVVRLGNSCTSRFSESCGSSLSGCLLVWWPVARSCRRESRLSEYVRAEAQDRLSRGTEKNRKVVMPHASPRVDANVTAKLKEGMGIYTAVQEIAMAQLMTAHVLLMFCFAAD